MKLKEIVRIMVRPMNLIGLNPLRRNTFSACYIRVFLCCFWLSYALYGQLSLTFHSQGNFYNLVIPIPYALAPLTHCFLVLYLQKHKRTMSSILSSINNGVFEYTDENDLNVEYMKYTREKFYPKLHTLVIIYEMAGFAFSFISPFVGYALVGELRTYIYPQWVPWKVDSTLSYTITFASQAVPCITIFLVYYTIQNYFAFVLVEFLKQYKKLRHTIRTLNDRTRRTLSTRRQFARRNSKKFSDYSSVWDKSDNRDEYSRIFLSNLIECIRHHQKMNQLFKNFNIFYNVEFSSQLTVGILSFGIFLYALVEEADAENFMSLIGATWLYISNLFFRCFIGEQFAAMNQEIRNSLFYETDWHLQSSSNRKMISIFHLLTSRSLDLKGFGTFNSSFYVYLAILKSSYSYYNLLRAST